MNRKHILILAALLAVVVGVSISFFKKDLSLLTTQVSKNKQTDEGGDRSSQDSSEEEKVGYDIPELGIRLFLPKDIANDFTYKLNIAEHGGKILAAIDLSSKSLETIDPKGCSAENHALGRITKFSGTVDELDGMALKDLGTGYYNTRGHFSAKRDAGEVKQFDGFIIEYSAPQSSCLSAEIPTSDPRSDQANRLNDKYMPTLLREAMVTAEPY